MADTDKCDKLITFAQDKPVGFPEPAVSCTPEEKKLPQELKEPTGVTESYVPAVTPRPIKLYSSEITVTCEEYVVEVMPGGAIAASEGVPVTMPFGQRTDTVNIQSIVGIDTSVLSYIVKANLEDEIERSLAARTLTAPALVALTGMQPSQAATFLQLALRKQAVLDEGVRALAISQLECLWWNDGQLVTCENDLGMSPGTASQEEHADAMNRVNMAAHIVSSSLGKTAANNTARAQAIALLNCFYISEAVTVSCTDDERPDRPVPAGELLEWVPTDPESYSPRRIGSVTLPFGAVISTVSVDDANATAKQLAYSTLNCFYVSRLVDRQCEDAEARSVGVDPEVELKPVGLYLSDSLPEGVTAPEAWNWIISKDARISAQRVVVPERYFTSELSTAAATKQARELADSLLACCYINDRIFIECPPEADREHTPVWDYEVVRGAFVSCNSKQEADDQAWASTVGVVECIYCNDKVLPQCVPNWVTKAVTSGIFLNLKGDETFENQGVIYNKDNNIFKLELPLNVDGLMNPITREPVDLSEWSMDATVGVVEDMICSPDKREVDEIAEFLPTLVSKPKKGVPTCRFKSTRLLAGCAFADPYKSPYVEPFEATDTPQLDPTNKRGGNTDSLAEPTPITYYATSEEGPYRVYKAKPAQTISAALSTPIPGTYIELPEGILTASASEVPGYEQKAAHMSLDEAERVVRDYLDGLVLEMAKSMIDCRYGNPVTYVACAWGPSYPSMADGSLPKDVADYASHPHFGDPGAGAWWDGEGKADPTLYPEAYMASGGATVADPVVIPARTFQGETYTDVLKQTKALAQSILNCQYMNQEVSCYNGGCAELDGLYLITDHDGVGMTVPAFTVQAENSPEATDLALEMLSCPDLPCLYGNNKHTCNCSQTSTKATTTPEGTTSLTVPQGFFVGDDASTIASLLVDYCETLCSIPPPSSFFFSAEVNYACACAATLTCSLAMEQVPEGTAAITAYNPGTVNISCTNNPPGGKVTLPAGAISAQSQKDADDLATAWAVSLCGDTLYTNSDAVVATCVVSTVPTLSSVDPETGDTIVAPLEGVYYSIAISLTEGIVTADTPDDVCVGLSTLASSICEQHRDTATALGKKSAITVPLADQPNVTCGKVCGCTVVPDLKLPDVVSGMIRLSLADTEQDQIGIISDLTVVSSLTMPNITSGVVQLTYADTTTATTKTGLICGISTLSSLESQVPTIENGVIKVPIGAISDIKFDTTIAEPVIENGEIKIPYADSTAGAGVISTIKVLTDITAPVIEKGDIKLSTADTEKKATGLVSGIVVTESKELSIAAGVIRVPLADGGDSPAAGLVKEVASSVSELKLSKGILTIPTVAKADIEFDEKWFTVTESSTSGMRTVTLKESAIVALTDEAVDSAMRGLSVSINVSGVADELRGKGTVAQTASVSNDIELSDEG